MRKNVINNKKKKSEILLLCFLFFFLQLIIEDVAFIMTKKIVKIKIKKSSRNVIIIVKR